MTSSLSSLSAGGVSFKILGCAFLISLGLGLFCCADLTAGSLSEARRVEVEKERFWEGDWDLSEEDLEEEDDDDDEEGVLSLLFGDEDDFP